MGYDKTVWRQEILPGYHDKPQSFWQRLPYRSDTGGTSPMFLEGLEKYTNHRINGGFTPERRAWRKQWLHDQHLSAREPVFVPELYRTLNNPFKRAFNYPFNKIEGLLKHVVGPKIANGTKNWLINVVQLATAGYIITYNLMFHQRDWTTHRRITVASSKPVIYPGGPGYPFVSDHKADDYANLGFKNSPLYKSEERIRAEYAAELAEKKAARAKATASK